MRSSGLSSCGLWFRGGSGIFCVWEIVSRGAVSLPFVAGKHKHIAHTCAHAYSQLQPPCAVSLMESCCLKDRACVVTEIAFPATCQGVWGCLSLPSLAINHSLIYLFSLCRSADIHTSVQDMAWRFLKSGLGAAGRHFSFLLICWRFRDFGVRRTPCSPFSEYR